MKHVARVTLLPSGSGSVARNWLRVSLPSGSVSQRTPSQSDWSSNAVVNCSTAGDDQLAPSFQATLSWYAVSL